MAGDDEAMGPISYLIVEFPGNKMTGEGFADPRRPGRPRAHPHPRPPVRDLRDADGSVAAVELRRHRRRRRRSTSPCSRARRRASSTQSDFDDAAAVIEPGSSAGILIFENRWATTFVQALRRGERAARRGRLHPASTPSSPRSTPPTPADRHEHDRRESTCQDCSEASPAPPSSPAPPPRSPTACRGDRPTAGPAQEAEMYEQQQYAAAAAAVRPAAAPAPAPAAARRTRSRSSRSWPSSRTQGILTEEEFAAQKAKILAA